MFIVLDIWKHCSSVSLFFFLLSSLSFLPFWFHISVGFEIIQTYTYSNISLHLNLPLSNGSMGDLSLSQNMWPGIKQLFIFTELAYRAMHRFLDFLTVSFQMEQCLEIGSSYNLR